MQGLSSSPSLNPRSKLVTHLHKTIVYNKQIFTKHTDENFEGNVERIKVIQMKLAKVDHKVYLYGR